MKLYRIRWRDGLWHVLCGEESIAASEDRDQLIQVARKVVARHDGELYVCNKGGSLEAMYAYTGQIESIRLCQKKGASSPS